MTLTQFIVGQFRRPAGPLGRVVGFILANRPSNRKRNAWTIELLGLEPGERVLELGCGPGVAIELALAKGARVLALDHSAVMVREARRRCGARAELRLGGIEALTPADGPFDAAFMINVAQFLPDRAAAFAAIARALRPDGRLAVTHQPRHRGASAADAERFAATLRADMAAAGFRTTAVHTLPLAPVPAVSVIGRT